MLKLGIQLYAVRDHFFKDMAGTLAQLKKIGYDFVSLDLEGYKTGKMNININN